MFSICKLETFLMVLLFSFILCGQSSMEVNQPPALKSRVGSMVEIPCNHSVSNYNLMCWYRHFPDTAPEVIIQGYGSTEDGRYHMSVNAVQLSSTLIINQLETGDSAVYYCTVRVHVGSTYTRALTFGKGTKLTVEPRDQSITKPSVFVLTSEDATDNTAACFAKDFYPKVLEMSMNSSTEGPVTLKESKAVLSKSGKYSAVQFHTFQKREEVRCTVKHQGLSIDSEAAVFPKPEPKPTSSLQPKPLPCKPKTRSVKIDVKSNEKVNALSLRILGLRVLFAKSLAFNVLLSVRLFAF